MLADHIDLSSFAYTDLLGAALPWEITARAEAIVAAMMQRLPSDAFSVVANVAVHKTARVDSSAVIHGPAIIGAGCFVGAHTLLRGGVWLDAACSVGPGCEAKSSFLFAKARLAHFNFIGDALIGADVNFEAGSIVANRRNERPGTVRAVIAGALVDTGCAKFGAVVGDGARIGANAVLAPGTLLPRNAVVGRLALVDQENAVV